jgi:GT2 family glycosyltransferase
MALVGISLLTCTREPEHRRATEVALHTLLRSDLPRGTAVVCVDNGSTDDTAEWVASLTVGPGNPVRVIPLAKNLGIPVARNIAAARLMADGVKFICEVHNDHVFPVSEPWLRPLLKAMDEYACLGIASSSLLTPNGTNGSPSVELDYTWNLGTIVAVVDDCARRHARPGELRRGLQHPCLKRVSMLREIGLYDESFHMMNWEDTDEVARASHAGWSHLVIGGSVVWHHYNLSRTTIVKDPDNYYDNRKRFLEKWPLEWLEKYEREIREMYAQPA